MFRKSRKGFTLIELLVVIAIIGILAAMLFPVFAKAREQARKIQCLANVKNIATALQMYVTDWEGYFPRAYDLVSLEYFDTRPGGKNFSGAHCDNRSRQANPYLREPPQLEDYIGNRDVWRCPSATVLCGALDRVIVPVGRDYNWVNNWKDADSWWPTPPREIVPCAIAWPSGWGGPVTDSFTQRMRAPGNTSGEGRVAASAKVFVQCYGINDNLGFGYQNPASIQDPARFIVVADFGDVNAGYLTNANEMAFPDHPGGSNACGMPDSPQCGAADWVNCTWSQSCGLDATHMVKFFQDPNYRKGLARHGGGSNIGFADGHAKWFSIDTIIFHAAGTADPSFRGGLCACWYPDITLPEYKGMYVVP